MAGALAGSAAAAEQCPDAARNAADAAAKAEWIIEGTVELVMITSTGARKVVMNQSSLVASRGPAKVYKTTSMLIGPCYTGALQLPAQGEVDRVTGKRVRLYGTQHVFGEKRRVFYAEPADLPLPAAAVLSSQADYPASIGHRNAAEQPIGGGWHRATSTNGGFTVDVPGPFADATRGGPHPGFMIRARAPSGADFLATFERAGDGATTAEAFDREYEEQPAKRTTFRGYPAVRGRSELTANGQKVGTRSLMFRVPGGTYTLFIATPPGATPPSDRDEQRFYESLR